MKLFALWLMFVLAMPAQTSATLRLEASALKARGDAAGALAIYEHAAALEPRAADLRDEVGFLLAVLGKQREAIAAFEEAIRLDPEFAPARYHLGVALWLQRDPLGAIREMKQAVRLVPGNAESQFRLASMQSEAGEPVEALAAARAASTLERKRADIWNLLGQLEQRATNLKAARVAFERAVALSPLAEYRNSLGFVLVDLGLAAEAVQQFRAIPATDPAYRDAQINIGYAHLHTGDYDAALMHFQALSKKYPHHAVIHYDLGLALKQKDQLEEAKAALKEALRLDKSLIEAYYTLGITYWQNGEIEEAAAAMRSAITARPDYAEAHYMLGTALKQLGDLAGASVALEGAIRLNPDTPGPYNTLAQVKQQQGDRAAAKELFAQAAEVKKKLDASQVERLRGMGPATRAPLPRP